MITIIDCHSSNNKSGISIGKEISHGAGIYIAEGNQIEIIGGTLEENDIGLDISHNSHAKIKGLNITDNITGVHVRGKSQNIKKIGRNAPCPCHSGKKYKKCCIK
ncbi:SEC-C metal-binding domain-containing protein [Providencia rettgeri]|nr:SEC-C domain-containing protein [Providencia rettgeri]